MLDAADRDRLPELQSHHAAPAAGQPAGHLVAVPAPPRQPAAARRDRRRRDVDGVADDDGPAAGGGPPGVPAGAGRRPRSAGLGGGRRGAGRPGRRSGVQPDSPVARLVTSHRFGASIGTLAKAIRTATPTPPSRCCPPAASTSNGWTPTSPRTSCAKCLCRMPCGCGRPRVLGDADAALATLDEHRMLCAHRRGPYGVALLEPAGRTLADRADRRAAVVAVVSPAGRCW